RSHLTVAGTKLTAGGDKNDAVDDGGRQRRDQIARGPSPLQRRHAVLLNDLPRNECAVCDVTVVSLEARISSLRAHSRRKNPSRAARVLPAGQGTRGKVLRPRG